MHPEGSGSASAIRAFRPAAAPATLPAPTSAASSRTPSVTQLPRLPPSPEQQRLVEAQADALFAALLQTRLQAATTLALDPALAADALPLAIERALGLLRNPPVDEAGAAGAANTVQLLLAAAPATLRQHAEAALQLADAVAAMGSNQAASAQQLRSRVAQARSARPPVAYLQIASDAQRPLAAAIGARLAAAGYAVPAVEKVGARAPSRTEVRIQGGSAPDWGRWLAKVVGELTAGPVKLGSLHSVRPATDTFEIWLAPELCVSRHVPACGA